VRTERDDERDDAGGEHSRGRQPTKGRSGLVHADVPRVDEQPGVARVLHRQAARAQR
jgi:hypothetical protein